RRERAQHRAAHRRQDHPPERELHRSGGPEVRADRPARLIRRLAPSLACGHCALHGWEGRGGGRPSHRCTRRALRAPPSPFGHFPRKRGKKTQVSSFESPAMNSQHRKSLPGTQLDWYDAREAVEALQPGAWDTLPYTARVHAENIVRRAEPARVDDFLGQLVRRERTLDFPWFPARVVCHDILGQTALVDLAGLRDAIAEQGGDPAAVNPVVPVQLIVDHSLAVECGGFDPQAFEKNRAIEDRRNEDRFHFIEWTRQAFRNVDVIPPGNGIMHQINLEKMSPVVYVQDGVAFPDTCVGT